jgi:hypothetical protein
VAQLWDPKHKRVDGKKHWKPMCPCFPGLSTELQVTQLRDPGTGNHYGGFLPGNRIKKELYPGKLRAWGTVQLFSLFSWVLNPHQHP